MHQSKERTVVIIKPDGVQRSLIGEIISRFERSGLKLVGQRLEVPTAEKVESHYLVDPEWKEKTGAKTITSYEENGKEPPSDNPEAVGQSILNGLKTYMSAGPVVVMCWQGAHAVKLVRKLVGDTQPLESDVGTIRGDFVMDSYEMSDADDRAVRNLVHASGDVKEAKKEIDVWFDEDELIDYSIVQEKILYDVNLNDILG